MKLHYYKSSNPDNLPPYEEYDFAKSLAGYKNKLSQACVEVHNLKYLGYGTEQDVYKPIKSTPGRIVRTSYDSQGHRF